MILDQFQEHKADYVPYQVHPGKARRFTELRDKRQITRPVTAAHPDGRGDRISSIIKGI
jgi:hypothetical protein